MNLAFLRPLGALALGLALVAPTPAIAAPLDSPAVTASFSQDLYELGDTLELTITGEAGAWVCILFDTQLGTYSLPGLITFDLAKSPAFSVLDLGPLPPTGEMVLSLPTDCSMTMLTQSPLHVQIAMFPNANPLPACMSEVQTLLIGNADCDVCPAAAEQDPLFSSLPGGTALFLGGAGGGYEFESQGELAEYGDGTARLQGVLRSLADPTDRFLVHARLTGRVDRSDAAFPPAGGPTLKLLPSAYVDAGGPIDPANWHYYTELDADLVGLDGMAGAHLRLEDTGAVQFGMGANGKNLLYGTCATLASTVLSQPTSGDVLVDDPAADLTLEVRICPTPLEDVCIDPSKPTGHILWWPEVSKHFMAAGDGVTFVEYADGTALLTGTVAVQGDPTRCFELDVHFSDRLDNGDVNFPPSGSPKWGNVDPASADESTWHYYERTEGMLRGCESFDGAVVALTRKGPAFQVGVGANYHDLDYGGSGWLYLDVLEQPTSGTTFKDSTSGDINLDFKDCPEPSAEPIVHYDFSGQAGSKVIDRAGALDLDFDAADGSLQWVSSGDVDGLRFQQGPGGDTCVVRPAGSNQSLVDAVAQGGGLTVQAYFLQDAVDAKDSRLVSFSSSTGVSDRNFSLMSYRESGSPKGHVRLTTSQSTLNKEFSSTWGAGTPVVVAMVYGQDGVVRVHHDGLLVESFTHGGTLAGWADRALILGNELGGDRPFHGELYDVKIWNRALTSGELVDEAGELLGGVVVPPPAAGPVAHWDFSSQAGTSVLDQVGDVNLAFHGDDFDWVTDANGAGLEFEEDDGDMLKSSSSSAAGGLRQAIQASNALTLQVFYSQDKDSDGDARLFSWSSGTDVTNRNLTMMSDWTGSSFTGELRLKTTSSTTQLQQGLGFGEDVAVVYTMTWDATTGVITSYLDGQLIGTDVHGGDLSSWSDHRIRLGNESGGDRSFEGVMYDVKLWDRALDGVEVSAEAGALLGL